MLRYVRASVNDQAKVEQFLQGVHDDLSEQVNTYLTQAQGGLYLALEDDVIVGTAVITFPKRHEGYLGSVRMAPPQQDRDLYKEFAAFQLKEAQKAGAHIVRALIKEDDTLWSTVLQEDFGFKNSGQWIVGEFQGFQAPDVPPHDAGPAWAVDKDRVKDFMQQFPGALWVGKDMYVPESLTIEDLENQFEEGGIAVAPQDARLAVDSIAVYRVRNNDAIDIKYFKSQGRYTRELLNYLWIEARAWGVQKMRFGLAGQTAEQMAKALDLPIQNQWVGTVLERQFEAQAYSLSS
ncbi:MAG: N-acetyltransferase [Sulfobacillus thermosulfidooxidans]|uniref:N-acetyltransferase n=1 Tax=Sulfobacillus TaxID=28033 RepID=UPI000CD00CF5|nr:N-acetyltransferase [Sulfobacillus sp. hq2]POB09787.1 GCN5 family acetyltransferase [Sulfobacillus sp. hq2]PSR36831.1 MAG: N-acetyltransferase [Sulfobacillus thermosulfidooxidans]